MVNDSIEGSTQITWVHGEIPSCVILMDKNKF